MRPDRRGSPGVFSECFPPRAPEQPLITARQLVEQHTHNLEAGVAEEAIALDALFFRRLAVTLLALGL